MTAAPRPETTGFIDTGSVTLHVRQWPGEKRPFLLLHGLSSNSRTWSQVAAHLSAAGHPVTAVDQRGHGRSDKPATGYDFASITTDLADLIAALKVERPYIVGQSWGGNVVLEFGARHPGLAAGLGFVDGGTIDFQADPANTWETIAERLRPPDLRGTPRDRLRGFIQNAHPDWTAEGVAATLDNFETLPDGTVRPWLSLDRHMAILRAMWEQRPPALYPRVREPVLILPAETGDAGWTASKRRSVTAAREALAQSDVVWFANTDHDIHVHRPAQLADVLLETVVSGIWST